MSGFVIARFRVSDGNILVMLLLPVLHYRDITVCVVKHCRFDKRQLRIMCMGVTLFHRPQQLRLDILVHTASMFFRGSFY
jgi:hypothetical protein